MDRALIFVVRTFRDADLLCSLLVKADQRAELLDQAMLLDESQSPLFPGYVAGVLCMIGSDAQAETASEVHQSSHIEALVLDRELSGQEDTGMEQLVRVYHATSSVQSDLLKNLLKERGIEAVVASDSIQSGVSAISGSAYTSVVLVGQDDAETARELVEQIESGESSLGATTQMDTPEDEQDSPVIDAWPTCPSCQKPRTTVCPICETSGNDFPLADQNFLAGQEADPDRLPVICSTCDEPWLAEFLRNCEWCNHDFGKGLTAVVPKPAQQEDQEINSRAGLVIIAMGVILLGLLIYFTVITTR